MIIKQALRTMLALFSCLAVSAHADDKFPAGTYTSDDKTLVVSPAGDYEISWDVEGEPQSRSGFALLDKACEYGGKEGNLWVISQYGTGYCFQSYVRGNRLIIQQFEGHMLGGIWISQ